MPLYERTKHQIYDDFERLKRQSSLCLNCKPKQLKFSIKHYRERYHNFFIEIFTQSKYKQIEQEYRDVLEKYFNNINNIKDINDVLTLTALCAGVLRDFGINEIGFNKDEFGI